MELINRMSEAKAASGPTRLAPFVTPDSKFFWDAADEERFVGQRCADCRAYRFPPRPMCPECHSLNTEIVELSGHGVIYSWIRPRHPEPYGFSEPPIVATVELDEGFRLVSNLVGMKLDEIKAGMPVEVGFEECIKNHKVPVFRGRTV